MTNMDKLNEQLNLLAKAQKPALDTDEKVVAAAEETGVDTDTDKLAGEDAGEGGASASEAGARDDGEGEDDAVLGKSFGIETASGEKVRAYDATTLLKSMAGRLETVEGEIAEDEVRREHLGKSLEVIVDLLKSQDAVIKTQTAAIDTLKKSVAEFGGLGRGRKSVITVAEKPEPALAKSAPPPGMSGQDFMAKALTAQKAGRITAHEIALAENYLNRGAAVPEGIVGRVMGER